MVAKLLVTFYPIKLRKKWAFEMQAFIYNVVDGGVTGEQGISSSPLPSLRSRPPEIQLGGLEEHCKSSPSGVWGGAPSDKRFGAF